MATDLYRWRHLALLICILLVFTISPLLAAFRYGDVLPRSEVARTLAALDAVMGQIYLTVLVARLVGLHIIHSHDSRLHDKG
jgi:hypothetical protein